MKKLNENLDKISAAFANNKFITQALQKGIQQALLKHKQAGLPIVVWKNNKITWIPPEKIEIKR